MAENYKIFPLRSLPGIKRDGTPTEGNYWNEGQWTRFYRGLPRSIPGYRAMTDSYPGPSRGLYVNLNGTGYLDVFSGSSDALSVGQFTTGGFGSGVTDITPAGFPADPNNLWQFDAFYNATGGGEIDLISHGAPNLTDISSNIEAPVYYGDITAAVAPLPAQAGAGGDFTISGGILALNPYVIAYGSLGLVAWSDINNPALFPTANAANPTSTKIVNGMSLRGSAAPAALLWSLNSILQMTFVGGDVVWSFSTLSDQSSILSSSGIVEFDGVYFWPGVDRFLTFNGALRELPNQMNLDFFYSNLNFDQRQKVFGYKIPRWGEIVWCFPKGSSTECNWQIVYNVREGIWYDSPLPPGGRSSAYFAQSWQYPIMFGATPYPASNYQLWQHEFGQNEIIGNTVNAIESFIESSDLSIVGGDMGTGEDNIWTQLVGMEPDFLFGNALNIQILTREFAQDDSIIAENRVITKSPPLNYFDTQIQGRYVRWRITCNEQNGYMIMGQPQFMYRQGDRTP